MKKIMLACLLIMPVLAACNNNSATSVSVHGVNYSDQEFTYVIQDPLHSSNQAGGKPSAVTRPAASCAVLPFLQNGSRE